MKTNKASNAPLPSFMFPCLVSVFSHTPIQFVLPWFPPLILIVRLRFAPDANKRNAFSA